MGALDIRAEGISKRYTIDSAGRRPDSLKELLGETLRGRGLFGRRADRGESDFWALRDVSFTVEKGEVVGIIGANGAGKSTLLKILSRITRPTEGRADIFGRISALLEVGTGFHPELTGRDNIFLNGAILGMRRAEIRRKLDEIVAFSGVEAFIDTPVKRYSSGMYVRLAFAVAAHLDPEILIVDEALAVGDAEFQERCLDKIREVARSGRTVLFISHNLGAVQTLCTRGIYLKKGRIHHDGTAVQAVSAYMGASAHEAAPDVGLRTDRWGLGQTRIVGVTVGRGDGPGPGSAPRTGSPARFAFRVERLMAGLSCSFTIYDRRNIPVTAFDSTLRCPADVADPGLGLEMICEVEELPLLPGPYWLNVALYTGADLQDHVEAAIVFEVEPGSMRGRPGAADLGDSSVCMAHRWRSPL
jgi:lipopolysaccharide transport system ATP-binding protein